MSEKRYKKYKFIKQQMASSVQNRCLDRIEESRIMPTNSQLIANPVPDLDTNQFCHFQTVDRQSTEEHNNTANDKRTANLKLLSFLKEWSVENKINHTQLGNLLKGLKDIFPEYNLPCDARTLLKTKRSSNIVSVLSKKKKIAQYTYFGIKEHLLNLLRAEIGVFLELKETFTIRLIFNIDGIPVSKNSNKQFWPILCKPILKKYIVSPFPIAIYYGDAKPNSLADYLNDFTYELNDILKHGLFYNNINFKVSVVCFTCDAPARAYLKNVKGHTGRNGCERCTEEGLFYKNRIIYENHNASARTHFSFENFHDINHHKNDERTPLLNISKLNIIEHFALDYMHLCCLGVMKKLLRHWCKIEFRLQQRNKLSKRMISAAKYLPSEFNRKSRPISELLRYKATEFRLFLLYLGPILLKGILPNHYYDHFLLFHAAIRILLHDKLRLDMEWLNKAREMLFLFVNDSSKLYGREFCIYNVHNLMHITDDVENLKYSLEELSCFPFENYLGKLINMLRRWNKPLAQIIKRLSENGAPTIKENISSKISIKVQNNKKKVQLPYFNLKSYGLRDCYVFIRNDYVLQILDILENKIVGRLSTKLKTFYKYPIKSKSIGIFQFDNFTDEIVSCALNEITHKAFVCKCHSYFVACDLLHLYH